MGKGLIMNLWIKNTSGQPSASLTLSVVAFCLTALWYLLGGILELPRVRAFDAGDAMAFLGPLLALYWGRRHSDGGAAPGSGEP